MVFEFAFIDPQERRREHLFAFHVKYGQDEERLLIVDGGYLRRDHL